MAKIKKQLGLERWSNFPALTSLTTIYNSGSKSSNTFCPQRTLHACAAHTYKQAKHLYTSETKQTNKTNMTTNRKTWEKETPQLTAGGTVNSSANLEICWKMFKKLKKKNLPYDPVIPLLSTCPKDLTFFSIDICSFMFTAALFTTASEWQQSKYPSSDEWIMKMFFIDNGILFSCKKNKIMTFAGNGKN